MSERPKKADGVFQIEIRLKPEFNDAAGAEALSLLHEAGLHTAREIRTSRLYEIHGLYNQGQLQQASRELLCDSVTEESRLDPQTNILNGMSHWRVEVWPKPSVSDPVGESVAEALAELGLPRPTAVRSAMVYRITGKCGRNHLEKAVSRCLSNPIIHRTLVSETQP